MYLPQPGAVPFQQDAVTHEMSVQANGCYTAQSPLSFVGQQTMRDAHGHEVVNPLFVVYGCFNRSAEEQRDVSGSGAPWSTWYGTSRRCGSALFLLDRIWLQPPRVTGHPRVSAD